MTQPIIHYLSKRWGQSCIITHQCPLFHWDKVMLPLYIKYAMVKWGLPWVSETMTSTLWQAYHVLWLFFPLLDLAKILLLKENALWQNITFDYFFANSNSHIIRYLLYSPVFMPSVMRVAEVNHLYDDVASKVDDKAWWQPKLPCPIVGGPCAWPWRHISV